MPWLIALVLVAGLAYLAYTSPQFRKGIGVLIAIIVAAVAYLIYSEQMSEHRATSAIAVNEVELRDVSAVSRTGLYYAKGSVKNLSASETLDSFELRARAHDCPDETLSDACETVGESIDTIKLMIPPGQVRGMDQAVRVSNLPAVRTLVWTFDVMSVRARTE